MFDVVTDEQRFPLLTEHGRRMLMWLREHPYAPRYTARCGNRLTADHLCRVRAYETELRSSPVGWEPGALPGWLWGFVDMCYHDVPFYRRYGARPNHFASIPTVDRADLSREPWSFVPDSLPIDDMAIYTTSGTTGHPLVVISHPVVGASYLPLLKVALGMHGITMQSGRGQVSVVLVGWQKRSYAYASVTPDQDDSGHLKLNLHPDDWRHPDDRARFLDACNPEIYTGDPLAFGELMRLPLKTRPCALISTAMALLPGLRAALQAHFGCPVLDVYSMNECGPIAVATDEGHALLQHRLYIEILDPDGNPCPPGVRGEVTLTGGLNFYLPLLRYRTNDYASLSFRGTLPVLVGLEGRAPVLFRSADGQVLNNLDVTNVLNPFALPQYTLHQAADGSLLLRVLNSPIDQNQLHEALLSLFGQHQPLTIEMVDSFGDKVIQYTTQEATIDFS